MNNQFHNKLICGDNLEELVKLTKESVDPIYIAPPLFPHKQKGAYEEIVRLKNEGKLDIKLVIIEDLLYKKKPIE